MRPAPRITAGVALVALAATALLPGCVRRTIRITSDPPGALVWLNDREVGRTPLDVDFVHYGTYDVTLRREGYESLRAAGEAVPPFWDVVGPDFVAEILPLPLRSTVEWHYALDPLPDDPAAERSALLERARVLRTDLGPAPEPPPAEADPAIGDGSGSPGSP